MNLVDTHIHLNDAAYAEDRDKVIQTAEEQGVKHIITNAIDEKSMQETLSLAKKYTIVHAALGLYPDTVVELTEDKIKELLTFIESKKNDIIAIGEIGLDYKYTTDENMREKQKKWFIAQLKLATKLDLPVQIHTRDAEIEVLDILDELNQEKVQLHCFAGGENLIKRAVKKGYYLSVPVKAVKNNAFQEIIKHGPMSRLLTETDGPYLHPVFGTRSDSTQVKLTIDKIAELKKSNPLEVAQIIFQNYKDLYEM